MDDRRFARPLFFLRDRVWRVYTGGAGFGAFLGDGSTDGHTPEEWIASAVRALGPAGRSEREGVSRLADGGGYFDDLSRDHRQALLGSRRELGVLVKLLDSAVRGGRPRRPAHSPAGICTAITARRKAGSFWPPVPAHGYISASKTRRRRRSSPTRRGAAKRTKMP